MAQARVYTAVLLDRAPPELGLAARLASRLTQTFVYLRTARFQSARQATIIVSFRSGSTSLTTRARSVCV
ncbi:hypothetical protein RRG08_011185 [Elysia crispata]|uniref:Uncharacterized protein n=1 Tax=Elysia crispata TaxID=231223 RepID=A0AAE0YDF3_9GAST|nr:hypothetical protein RRG08_011185 [Elysia crispata]